MSAPRRRVVWTEDMITQLEGYAADAAVSMSAAASALAAASGLDITAQTVRNQASKQRFEWRHAKSVGAAPVRPKAKEAKPNRCKERRRVTSTSWSELDKDMKVKVTLQAECLGIPTAKMFAIIMKMGIEVYRDEYAGAVI